MEGRDRGDKRCEFTSGFNVDEITKVGWLGLCRRLSSVMEIILNHMRCSALNQSRDLSARVMYACFGVQVMVQMSEF